MKIFLLFLFHRVLSSIYIIFLYTLYIYLFGPANPMQFFPINRGSKPQRKSHRQSIVDLGLVEYDKKRLLQIYSFPAIVDVARFHCQSQKFGYRDKKISNNAQNNIICCCCQTPVCVEQLGLCESTQPTIGDQNQNFKLNSGSSMFFAFIKLIIVFLLMRFLVADAYNTYTNLMVECNSDPCEINLMSRASIFNKQKSEFSQLILMNDTLNLVLVGITILFFIFYKRYQFQIYNQIDNKFYTQDDFTLFLENLPVFIETKQGKYFDYEGYLKEALEKKITKWIHQVTHNQVCEDDLDQQLVEMIERKKIQDKEKVTSVSLCQDLSEIEKIMELREELMQTYTDKHEQLETTEIEQEIQQAKVNKNICCDNMPEIPIRFTQLFQFASRKRNQIQTLNEEYFELVQRFAQDDSMGFNFTHFLGKAFVSFNYELYCEYFEREYLKNSNFLELEGKPIKISRAVDPTDVLWFNLKLEDRKRLKTVIFSYVIMAMVLFTALAMLVGLQFLKNEISGFIRNGRSENEAAQDPQYQIINMLLSTVMSCLTVAVDYLLAAIIEYQTESEKHKTKTDHITSLITKYSIAQFINTAFIYYIIFTINEQIRGDSQATDPLSPNGLIAQVMNLVITSSLIKIGMNVLQTGDLLRRWKIRNYNQLVSNQNKNQNQDLNKKALKTVRLFQIQLNRQYEFLEFNFARRYSEYIVFCLIACFYAYIAPLATIIIVVAVFVQYWVDKYNLFKRFSCPVNFNFRLSKLTITILQSSILVIVLGNILFVPWVRDTGFTLVNLISIVVVFLYYIFILLLPRSWQKKLFESVENDNYEQQLSFKQCVYELPNCYWRCNPATSFSKQMDVNDNKKALNYGQKKISNLITAQNYDKPEKQGLLQTKIGNENEE